MSSWEDHELSLSHVTYLSPQGYKLENENMFSDFACVVGTEEGERGSKANYKPFFVIEDDTLLPTV